MKVVILKLNCNVCGHEWIPRTESPSKCPNCKSNKWHQPLNQEEEEGTPNE